MDTYIRAVNSLARVAGVTAAFLIGLAVLVICDMVIERYIFNLTTIWQIDVVTYAIVAATFVGSAYVLMTRGHVNVEILPLYLGRARATGWRSSPRSRRSPSASCFSFSARNSGTRPGPRPGARTRYGARACGFPICRCRSASACLILQYVADILALVTGRAPPFGLSPKEDVDEFGREQAKQVLGEIP